MTDFLLTVDEFARERRVSKITIYRLIWNNDLRATKVGGEWRISSSEAAQKLGYWPRNPVQELETADEL